MPMNIVRSGKKATQRGGRLGLASALLRVLSRPGCVIAGRTDYEWSRDVVLGRRLAERHTVLFSPVHGVLDPGTLGRWILDEGLAVRLQVQLHKYLGPGVTRGV